MDFSKGGRRKETAVAAIKDRGAIAGAGGGGGGGSMNGEKGKRVRQGEVNAIKERLQFQFQFQGVGYRIEKLKEKLSFFVSAAPLCTKLFITIVARECVCILCEVGCRGKLNCCWFRKKMMGTRNRYPFTAAQWEEFEQQALIYKYMLAGVPVPPHLLYSLKRNLDYSSTLVLPTRGWGGSYGENEMVGAAGAGCMSYGWGDRRIDPEPGRCRRTDGKKWRCSKEAHPDSKYCERHMHRGRNKTNNSCSRKPVEFLFTSTTTAAAAAAISTSSINHSTKSPKLSSFSYSTPLSSCLIPTSLSHDHQNPLLYPSSSRPPTHPQHLMDTTMAYSQQDKDHKSLSLSLSLSHAHTHTHAIMPN